MLEYVRYVVDKLVPIAIPVHISNAWHSPLLPPPLEIYAKALIFITVLFSDDAL